LRGGVVYECCSLQAEPRGLTYLHQKVALAVTKILNDLEVPRCRGRGGRGAAGAGWGEAGRALKKQRRRVLKKLLRRAEDFTQGRAGQRRQGSTGGAPGWTKPGQLGRARREAGEKECSQDRSEDRRDKDPALTSIFVFAKTQIFDRSVRTARVIFHS
jgi:hypothetical protein